MPVVFKGLKKTRRRAFKKKAPVNLYPKLIEARYVRLVLGFADELKKIIRADLYPQIPELYREMDRDLGPDRNDDFKSLLDRIIAGIVEKYTAKVKREEESIARIATEVDRWSKNQTKKTIQSQLGVNILGADRSLSGAVNVWVQQNVDLIVNISQAEKALIAKHVVDAYQAGFSHQVLRDGLEDHWRGRDKRKTDWVQGMSVPYRSRLVAVDQIGKLNGQITQLRQTGLGVKRYTWRTCLDERVRDEHRKLEGKVFYWKSEDGPTAPPHIVRPGFPIKCRCYGEPDLSELLGFDPNE